jgi:hypothetical protein
MSLVSDVLAEAPECALVVIGPQPGDAGWSDLTSAFPSRVQLLGPVLEPAAYLEAADIYLDSFPFSSLTSMYEAATFETPVVSLRCAEAGAMAADDAYIDLHLAADAATWLTSVRELVAQPALRAARGAELSRAIGETHGRAAVIRAIERLYQVASSVDPASVVKSEPPMLDGPDSYLATYQLVAGIGRTAPVLLSTYGLLPSYLG